MSQLSNDNYENSCSDLDLIPEQMQALAWDLGSFYPISNQTDFVAFTLVNVRLSFVFWHVRQETIDSLHQIYGDQFNGSCFVIRLFDITDVVFDGHNAHSFFDISIDGLQGKRYIPIHHLNRNYISAIGFRLTDGRFHLLSQSSPCYFGLDRPSGQFNARRLYVRESPRYSISIEKYQNIHLYERLNKSLKGFNGQFSLSQIYVNGFSLKQEDLSIEEFINNISSGIRELGFKTQVFFCDKKDGFNLNELPSIYGLHYFAGQMFQGLFSKNHKNLFSIIHCHDWSSSFIGLRAVKFLKIPMVVTLHSVEEERIAEMGRNVLSPYIRFVEESASRAADLVIVPQEKTRDYVIHSYKVPEEQVIIIPSPKSRQSNEGHPRLSEFRESFGFDSDSLLGLFAGEISYPAGVDLLVEALPEVLHQHANAHIIIVGEGPLKGFLQQRVHQLGLNHRCHFWGHVDQETFSRLFRISDFIILPGRQRQPEDVARLAIEQAKPVLTTHQSQISFVRQGYNGLVAYEHKGSIVWGLNEMLSRFDREFYPRSIQTDFDCKDSAKRIALEHLVQYGTIFQRRQGGCYV